MDSLHSSRVSTRGGYSAEQLEAIKLFGRKDLEFGCILRDKILGNLCKYIAENLCIWEGENDADIQHRGFREERFEILGHIPHLEDLHRMMNEKFPHGWEQISKIRNQSDSLYNQDRIIIHLLSSSTVKMDGSHYKYIPYDSNLPLIDQPSLPEIISLFK